MSTRLRILTADEVNAALPMAEAIAAVRSGFGQLASGQAVVPLRTQFPGDGGTALVMPAYLPADRGLGAKIASVFPNNPARGLSTVTALVILLEADSGYPLAIFDGTRLTAIRTGAASGLATDLLAPAGADTLALFGAGAQARTQLVAICTVRPIRTVWVYDAIPAVAESLVAEMMGHEPVPTDLRVARTAAEATRSASILATATTSLAPVFADEDLLPGAHINAIGAFTPQMQEVPPETVGRARVFVDQVGQPWRRPAISSPLTARVCWTLAVWLRSARSFLAGLPAGSHRIRSLCSSPWASLCKISLLPHGRSASPRSGLGTMVTL